MRYQVEAIRQLAAEEIDQTAKGLPARARVAPAGVAAQHWNVLASDLPFPVMVIRESALAHNLRAMAEWCARHDLWLAPHGKTTMAPQILARQAEAGAWAITFATVSQAMVGAKFGFERLLIANQVTGAANLRALAALVDEHECYCLIDSVEGARALAAGLERAGARRPLGVLVEWGRAGWRTGVRSVDGGLEVLAEAARHPRQLRPCGVEAFEGLASSPAGPEDEAREVDEFLAGLRELGRELRLRLPADQTPLLSIGGTAFLDRVLDAARQVAGEFRVVIRSGCYVTHDHGFYRRKQEAMRARAGDAVPDFIPALELWSVVQSTPSPGLAYLTFGKRDCSHDLELPMPLASLAAGEPLSSARPLAESRVTGLNDQHAAMKIGEGEEVGLGDLVCCGLSHPCTAFDKWRVIPIVDDDYNVIDLYRTFF
jgi:D-serine dehydratase